MVFRCQVNFKVSEFQSEPKGKLCRIQGNTKPGIGGFYKMILRSKSNKRTMQQILFSLNPREKGIGEMIGCLLYTSDAADE